MHKKLYRFTRKVELSSTFLVNPNIRYVPHNHVVFVTKIISNLYEGKMNPVRDYSVSIIFSSNYKA